MAVTKRLRYEILRRDNHTCRYCGSRAPEVKLTVDHVLPVALGGSDEPENLVAACRDCNAGKSSTQPSDGLVAGINQQQLIAKAALQEAIKARRAAQALVDDIVDQIYEWWPEGDPDSYGALLWMIRSGLDLGDFRRATLIAQSKRDVPRFAHWRYFMGICRNMVAEIQQDAEKIVIENTTPATCGHCQACLEPEDFAFKPECELSEDNTERMPCRHCGDPTCVYELGFDEGNQAGVQEMYRRLDDAIDHYANCTEVNHG